MEIETRYQIVYSPSSEADLHQTAAYLARHSASASLTVLKEIKKRIDALAKMPRLHPVYEMDQRYRRMVVGSWLVFYRIIEEDRIVFIARVYRVERNVGAIEG